MGHSFAQNILRENDIRGRVGIDLFSADAFAVGQAFGHILKNTGGHQVALGYDGRHTSVELEKALCEGLLSSGINVLRVGLGPSPMLYFAVKHFKTDGGIMVTGSHNPSEFNGFKMLLQNRSFYGQDIKNLAQLAAEGIIPANSKGTLKNIHPEVKELYTQRLLQDIKPVLEANRSLRVAWDPGNGASAEILEKLIEQLPGHHVVINDKIDGSFPAHHPDPTVAENLIQLQDLVITEQCDLGIGFDGDGDRIGIVDDEGTILWGDQLLILYAEEILKTSPGAPIIADVKASQTLFDEIVRLGGQPIMWKTGHSFIKSKMIELQAPLAGEMSGHIFFADQYYGFDDALYASLRLLKILAQQTIDLSEIRQCLPQVINTPELRFNCSDERKFHVVEEIKNRLIEAKADFTDVDGVRVKTSDGWWLLRASNTQDVLVARAESTSPKGLKNLQKEIINQLKLSDIEWTL